MQEERKAAGGKSLRGYTSASFESEHTMATAHRARNRTVRNFLRDTRAAATAIVAAVASVMVVGGAAVVIDHSWLVDHRDTLKSASVAASIAATHEMGRAPTDLSPETLKTRLEVVARRYVLINLAHLSPERFERASESLTLSVTPDRAAGTVRVVASADLGGTLLSQHLPLLGEYPGPGSITVDVGTERNVNPVEVVLAIDITASMAEGVDGTRPADPSKSRMATVKKAAKELAKTLLTDVDAPVAVALVPWHFTVRLSETTRTKWMDEDWAVYPTTQEYSYPYSGWRGGAAAIQEVPKLADTEWLGCLQQRSLSGQYPPGIEPDLPSTEPFTQAFFMPAPNTVYQCYTEPFPHNYNYQRCYDKSSITVPMRDDNYDSIPGGKHAQKKPVQYGCYASMASMMGLSRKAQMIATAIDAMTPVGSATYSSLGLIWGRRMLDPTWRTVWGGTFHPVDSAGEHNEGVRKVIVLLTDGVDNWARSNFFATSREDACKAAKDSGLEIFIVAAMVPRQSLETELRECSSESSESDTKYAYLNNETNDDLLAAFRNITNDIVTIRRTH